MNVPVANPDGRICQMGGGAEWVPTPKGKRGPLNIFANFPQKLHENKENWTGRGCTSLAPATLVPPLVTFQITWILPQE